MTARADKPPGGAGRAQGETLPPPNRRQHRWRLRRSGSPDPQFLRREWLRFGVGEPERHFSVWVDAIDQ